jgi:hypothetical protein
MFTGGVLGGKDGAVQCCDPESMDRPEPRSRVERKGEKSQVSAIKQIEKKTLVFWSAVLIALAAFLWWFSGVAADLLAGFKKS